MSQLATSTALVPPRPPRPPIRSPRPPIRRRFSPSALDAYNVCPRRFRLKYLDRVPVEERPSPVLVQGNAVHGALDRFMGLSDADRTPENLERALRAAWPEHRVHGAFAGREDEASYGVEAIEMLERYGRRERLSSARILAREKWVSARLDNGVTVFGKVDRFDASPRAPRTLEVIDYKVSKGPAGAEDVHLPDETAACDVYALASEAETGWEVDRVRFLYLRGDSEAQWNPEREDLEAAHERLVDLTDQILGDEEFEARPGQACHWCPFELVCPDAGRTELDSLEVVEDMPF